MRLAFSSILLAHGISAFHMTADDAWPSRRTVLKAGGGIFGLPFLGGDNANASNPPSGKKGSKGPTNEVVKVVNGMKRRRLGGSDIFVSELGLGTQRWVSNDFNAPSKELCYEFMDEAILKRGVNLIGKYHVDCSHGVPKR